MRRHEDRFTMPPAAPIRTPWWFKLLFWALLCATFVISAKVVS